jgi:NADH:ubiquinone oxidoreductase subunit 3 (subunit A)
MQQILLAPPVAFIVFLGFLFLLSRLFSRLALRVNKEADGTGKSYACGEDIPDNQQQPDYSQFFQYAFFFTIVHVAVLMVTTVPMETPRALVLALSYICAVIVGSYILLRR